MGCRAQNLLHISGLTLGAWVSRTGSHEFDVTAKSILYLFLFAELWVSRPKYVDNLEQTTHGKRFNGLWMGYGMLRDSIETRGGILPDGL